MNILPLVFTVLLVLALFTNAQLENFLRFSIIKKEYEKYMVTHDRNLFNKRQEALFSSSGSSSGRSKNRKIENRRLNFNLIINRDAKNNNDANYLQHRFLLKELMKNLYRKTDFYQEMLAKRPQFIDELLDRLPEVANQKGFNYIQNADQLDLKDEDLQFVYYSMFKNSPKVDQSNEHTNARKNNPRPTEDDVRVDPSEDEVVEDLEDEFKAEKGHKSLKDFLHVHENQKKINIYLAPQEILLTIFPNKKTVNELINMREELFRKKTDPTEAKLKLEEFKNALRPEIKEELLDFSVSKTNPKPYR